MKTNLHCFVNMYVSGIHAGIQSLHVSQELRNKYEHDKYEHVSSSADVIKINAVFDWATIHKTVAVLNGGDNQKMAKIRGLLESPKNSYPYASFKESGLGNQLTAVCILLPEKMYDSKVIRAISYLDSTLQLFDGMTLSEELIRPYSDWELEFLKVRATCGWAT